MVVHYVAWLEQGGSAVDSSRDRNDGKPVEFILGNGIHTYYVFVLFSLLVFLRDCPEVQRMCGTGDVLRGVDQVVSTMQVICMTLGRVNYW